ncbi:MAG: sugar transferase, partial [Bacillota bacterium]
MKDLLLLVHRIPFPPNKGDKIRSYHLLRHLAKRFRVHLGTFVDDESDWQYVDAVRPLCGETKFRKLDPVIARARSLKAMAVGRPLSLDYYRDRA